MMSRKRKNSSMRYLRNNSVMGNSIPYSIAVIVIIHIKLLEAEGFVVIESVRKPDDRSPRK